jgi:hypothetical protein
MGGKQLDISDYELTTTKKLTKRKKFLSEMEVFMPWQAPLAFDRAPTTPWRIRKAVALLILW